MKYKAYPNYKDSGVEWLGEVPEHWVIKKLSYWTTDYGSGTTPSNEKHYSNEGIWWVTTGELRENIIYSTQKSVTDAAVAELSSLRVHPKGSMLIAMYGATIGRVAVLGVAAASNQACFAIYPNRSIKIIFLKYWFQGFRPDLIALATGGGQPNINADKILNLIIPAPNIEEQQQIANFLDKATSKIDDLISKQERLIALLGEKRQAMISHAVTKGLNPNVPMKDSGVEWLGEVPEHWEVKRVKDIATANDESLSEAYQDDFQIDYIDIGSVSTGSIDKYESMMFSSAPSRARRIIKNGDVLISTVRTYLRAIAPVEAAHHNFIASTGFAVIRPSKGIISNFMKYSLLASYFVDLVEASSVGVSYPAINTSELVALKVVVPAPTEQQQIADYLDDKTAKLDVLVEKAKKQIELLQEKRTALISAAVTGKIDVREAA